MNRITHELTYPGARTVAAALLAALALASPWPAAADNQAPAPMARTRPAGALMAQAGSTQAPAPVAKTKASSAGQVEARIHELHTKLRITPEQEEQWKKVAEVMEDNAKRMEEISKARAEKAETMSAVEDLKAYGAITEVHAEGIKNFVAAFEPLYDSMSDAQKKNADALFRHPPERHRHTASKPAQSAPKTN
jgi:periplasmic protein CpxP/Spy